MPSARYKRLSPYHLCECAMETSDQIHISMTSNHVVACGVSDRGLARRENEDAIFLSAAGNLFLLADGVGGHERGAEASRMAIDIMQPYFHPEAMKAELSDITDGCGVSPGILSTSSLVGLAVNRANKQIYKRNQRDGLKRFMGTTVVGLVLLASGHALWFHVGDSRLYRWRNDCLQCLTTDHSAYMEWVRNGRKGIQPKKNIITRAIGPNPAVTESTGWERHQKDDIYILCSDGLTDMISEERISEIFRVEIDVGRIASCLIEAANDAGGKDNVSAVVCRV